MEATDNGYTVAQILQKERDILLALQWKLNPPTLNFYMLFFMKEWDLFSE